MTTPPTVVPVVEMWTDGACKGNPGPGGWGALLRSGALICTQFHPEKSGPTGRALLAAFARGALDARPIEAAAWS